MTNPAVAPVAAHPRLAGLSSREAQRRLVAQGPNELHRRGGRRWPKELLGQFTHPLALLLIGAALLALAAGTPTISVAIGCVVLLNAGFAFVQEMEAERAVEALASYLPEKATVVRDGQRADIDARLLVTGDVLVVEEGDRICADARILTGEVEVDMSTLTGESVAVTRSAGATSAGSAQLEARDLLFSGTTCLGGEAAAEVVATGMRTELGRIAALSERVVKAESPLERQVKRVAWLIAAVAVGAGVAFLPLGLAAGLSLSAALSFAIGLLVANVPEGLLPTITLALAVGVRDMARRGAVVKRLSAVETLGSTTVICTDKTGTLTLNQMHVTEFWSAGAVLPAASSKLSDDDRSAVAAIAEAAARCTTAALPEDETEPSAGDPTELALLRIARRLGVGVSADDRDACRISEFRFDPRLLRMTTVDQADGLRVVNCKGAPEALVGLSEQIARDGAERPMRSVDAAAISAAVTEFARRGLRVLAICRRRLAPDEPVPADRETAERGLCLLGLVAMIDPPRAEVAAAIEQAHTAGIRVHVVTGDHALTAAEIARQVGIGHDGLRTITGTELQGMTEPQLDDDLTGESEIVFARSSPEAKLRIADALRDLGHVVAMTGDGVNDAPALRRADIGVAMGRSGTDVAREAATMVLTDDNFATIVAAIEAGRRVYDNVRKFILYIFTHAVPEVVPFLVFALSGGAIPLPLTVMQILAVDLGTDTLPALALSREPAEPGLMDRPPRSRKQHVIDRRLLARAWGFLGVISAALVLTGFFVVLLRAGWQPGAPTGAGHPLHHAYRQATTIAWLGIVACQVGTAFAARTDHVSLWRLGVFSNRPLLKAIGFELALAAAIAYIPALHGLFGTASPTAAQLALIAPYPFIVWGADEIRRAIKRHRLSTHQPAPVPSRPSTVRDSPTAGGIPVARFRSGG